MYIVWVGGIRWPAKNIRTSKQRSCNQRVGCLQWLGSRPLDLIALIAHCLIFYCFLFYIWLIIKVSWVRHRDVHILTAGEKSFTTDQRFSAKHNTDDEWVLVIKYVQVSYNRVRIESHKCDYLKIIFIWENQVKKLCLIMKKDHVNY